MVRKREVPQLLSGRRWLSLFRNSLFMRRKCMRGKSCLRSMPQNCSKIAAAVVVRRATRNAKRLCTSRLGD